jgi:NHL repeat
VGVDGSGNVYISSLASGLLKETLTAGSYAQSTIARTVYSFGIAVDAQGNIYLGDNVNNQVLKETLSNNSYTQSTIATGLSGPHGVAVDGSGNVYIADSQIVKETLSGGSYIQSTLANGFNDPLGIAVDSSGNVFASSPAANSVWKVYFSDPPSLSFATTSFGSTGSDSPKTVTVQNVGNAALSFPVPSIGNNPSIASNFTLDNSGSSDCPLSTSSSSASSALSISLLSFAISASMSISMRQ